MDEEPDNGSDGDLPRVIGPGIEVRELPAE
jgi:hypothetical protein